MRFAMMIAAIAILFVPRLRMPATPVPQHRHHPRRRSGLDRRQRQGPSTTRRRTSISSRRKDCGSRATTTRKLPDTSCPHDRAHARARALHRRLARTRDPACADGRARQHHATAARSGHAGNVMGPGHDRTLRQMASRREGRLYPANAADEFRCVMGKHGHDQSEGARTRRSVSRRLPHRSAENIAKRTSCRSFTSVPFRVHSPWDAKKLTEIQEEAWRRWPRRSVPR